MKEAILLASWYRKSNIELSSWLSGSKTNFLLNVFYKRLYFSSLFYNLSDCGVFCGGTCGERREHLPEKAPIGPEFIGFVVLQRPNSKPEI